MDASMISIEKMTSTMHDDNGGMTASYDAFAAKNDSIFHNAVSVASSSLSLLLLTCFYWPNKTGRTCVFSSGRNSQKTWFLNSITAEENRPNQEIADSRPCTSI